MRLMRRLFNNAIGPCFFILLIIISLFVSCNKASKAELQPTVPLTSEQLEKYIQQAKERVLQSVDLLISSGSDQKRTESPIRQWNRLSSEILVDFSLLSFLSNSEFPTKIDAAMAMQNLQAFLQNLLLQNPDLFRTLIGYVGKSLMDGPLTPYEHHQIALLLESCENIRPFLSKEDQKNLNDLKKLNSKYEKAPFIYLKSQTPEKAVLTDKPLELTVLSLNTCFVPGNLPVLFGGVYLPWQQRVPLLSEKILSINADLVCLQEVLTEDACHALYETLKNDYTYFYMAIGPRFLGFSLDSLGLPSGLFVASKYPIKNPQFTLFPVSGFPMNYGVFDFVVQNQTNSIAHIYTTHMQAALNYESFEKFRTAHMNQVVKKMQGDLKAEKQNIPFFLCGDLNIPYGSQEPGELLIRTHFYDDYNSAQKKVCAENRTCSDYFTNSLLASEKELASIDPNFQIIDYALLLKNPISNRGRTVVQPYEIHTVLVPMNEIAEPKSALSDHHGLITTISPKSAEK